MTVPHAPTRWGARRGRAVVGLLLAGGLLVGCAGAEPGTDGATEAGTEPAATGSSRTAPQVTPSPTPEPAPSPTPEAPAPTSAEPPAPAAPAAVVSEGVAPATVSIPRIDVVEDLMDLGLKDDGTMAVPSDWDRAGWFTGGGKPGGRGPTVIAGHVDSPTGPAVFHRLTELEVGDQAMVTDVDGTEHTYEVYRVENLPKDDYPTALVFGAVATDELRLITCTGEFDTVSQRHEDNRVVFARAVGA